MLPLQERHFVPMSLMTRIYAPNISVVRISWTWRDEPSLVLLGSPSKYTMFLLLNMVPQEYLDR